METQNLEELTDQLSKLAWSENFDVEKITRLLIKRNSLLLSQKNLNFSRHSKDYLNYCEYLTENTVIPYEFRAYHSGPVGQIELTEKEKDFENLSRTNHLFFSISLEETIREYMLPAFFIERGIYITDLRNLKNGRVQVHYDSQTLFNDQIRTLIDCYKDQDYMKKILTTDKGSNTRFIHPFENKPSSDLRDEIIRKIRGWISHNTIPFYIKHLQRYKNRYQTYILIPSPIKVNYY